MCNNHHKHIMSNLNLPPAARCGIARPPLSAWVPEHAIVSACCQHGRIDLTDYVPPPPGRYFGTAEDVTKRAYYYSEWAGANASLRLKPDGSRPAQSIFDLHSQLCHWLRRIEGSAMYRRHIFWAPPLTSNTTGARLGVSSWTAVQFRHRPQSGNFARVDLTRRLSQSFRIGNPDFLTSGSLSC